MHRLNPTELPWQSAQLFLLIALLGFMGFTLIAHMTMMLVMVVNSGVGDLFGDVGWQLDYYSCDWLTMMMRLSLWHLLPHRGSNHHQNKNTLRLHMLRIWMSELSGKMCILIATSRNAFCHVGIKIPETSSTIWIPSEKLSWHLNRPRWSSGTWIEVLTYISCM